MRRRSLLASAGALSLVGRTVAAPGRQLKVWTWYPDAKVYAPAVERFERLNPGVRIELTLLDSKAIQEKVPLALATGEQLDVVPVQPQMAAVIAPHLLDLEPMLKELQPDWRQAIWPQDVAESERATAGRLKYLPLMRMGAMLLYYNAQLIARMGLPAPRTRADVLALAGKLHTESPGVLPVAVNGRDGWTMNEVLWTMLAQSGDYYDRFHFDGAPLDAPPVVQALHTLRRWFVSGAFSLDVLDFDYGRSQQLFTSGRAATYIQGSWESWLLSAPLRKARGVALNDVGVVALPTERSSMQQALCSHSEVGAAVSRHSRHPELAARWIHFLVLGEGARLMAQKLPAAFSQRGVLPGDGLLVSAAATSGMATLDALLRNPAPVRLATAQFQSFNGLERAINRVIHGLSTPEEAAREMQQRWTNHLRRFRRRAV